MVRDTHKLPASDYMDPHINPPEFLRRRRAKKEAELAKMSVRGFPRASPSETCWAS